MKLKNNYHYFIKDSLSFKKKKKKKTKKKKIKKNVFSNASKLITNNE